MGHAQKLPSYISAEDYLLLEERATTKHEYLDGVIYDWQGGAPHAMAGGSLDHNRVSGNVFVSLQRQLGSRGCEAFIADVRVSSAAASAFFYPDVVVTCSTADQASMPVVREPVLIVEVLSMSTEVFDRGDKFGVYRQFPSLQSYVLISPERRSIEVFSRASGWTAVLGQESTRLEGVDSVMLEALELNLHASEVFARLG